MRVVMVCILFIFDFLFLFFGGGCRENSHIVWFVIGYLFFLNFV